jgi:hypothetical protein
MVASDRQVRLPTGRHHGGSGSCTPAYEVKTDARTQQCPSTVALTMRTENNMRTTTAVDTDSRTWAITGSATCDVDRCSQDAAIIADVSDQDRFCIKHTAEAAAVAALYPVFGGWYRITASRYEDLQLSVTVHPL